MTEKAKQALQERQIEWLLKRLERTGRDECICLHGWEVGILLEYIDALKEAAEKGEKE